MKQHTHVPVKRVPAVVGMQLLGKGGQVVTMAASGEGN